MVVDGSLFDVARRLVQLSICVIVMGLVNQSTSICSHQNIACVGLYLTGGQAFCKIILHSICFKMTIEK